MGSRKEMGSPKLRARSGRPESRRSQLVVADLRALHEKSFSRISAPNDLARLPTRIWLSGSRAAPGAHQRSAVFRQVIVVG